MGRKKGGKKDGNEGGSESDKHEQYTKRRESNAMPMKPSGNSSSDKSDSPAPPGFFDNFTILLVGVSMRLALFLSPSWQRWCAERPELNTPFTSWTRVRDGVALDSLTGSAYSGDRVHVTPLMMLGARFVVQFSDWHIFCGFVAMDVVNAFLLCRAAHRFLVKDSSCSAKDATSRVYKWYLLNPVTAASCAALSLSSFYAFLCCIFIATLFAGRWLLCVGLLSLWTQFTLFPITLIAPVITNLPRVRFLAVSMFAVLLGIFTATNYVLNGGNWDFIKHTYWFAVTVADQTPNVGLYWYFFVEIFVHFYDFFIILFQLHALVYIVPFAITLRKCPHLHLLVSLALLAVLVPYPTLTDAAIPLALLPIIQEKYLRSMRFPLVMGCTFCVCIVLMPVMWYLWLVSGSGNANFFFGVTLFYNAAIIHALVDIIYAYKRVTLEEKCPADVPNQKTLIRFD